MPIHPSNREAGLLRFGVFEVDLFAGELRKNGARIRLQEQPFQVLAALLQNAGQVVTREDLREKIWPADTFVDFDHSLNTAVNKIREALGDSASSPRFVETLARRGYRFIAPVDGVAAAAEVSAPANAQENYPASSPAAEIALHPALHVPVPRRKLVRALFALIQVMYLIFYVLCPGLESSVHRGRGVGDGSGGDPAAVLFTLRGRLRFPQAGRNIRTALPICSGAGSTLGHRAVPAPAADRRWLGVRRDRGFAVRTFFGENSGPHGLSTLDFSGTSLFLQSRSR